MLAELWSDVRYRLRALFRREAMDRELGAELRAHIEQEAEAYERRGLTREEARLDVAAAGTSISRSLTSRTHSCRA